MNNMLQITSGIQFTVRRGLAMTEVVVAASLLMTSMTIILPMIVRSNQLRRDTNTEQMLIEELSSQVERLSHLSNAARESAVADLVLPQHLATLLPGAQLLAKIEDDADGKRIVVTLVRARTGAPSRVTLIGWIDPLPAGNLDSAIGSGGDE